MNDEWEDLRQKVSHGMSIPSGLAGRMMDEIERLRAALEAGRMMDEIERLRAALEWIDEYHNAGGTQLITCARIVREALDTQMRIIGE
jgi:hypothetical protein